MPTTDLGTFHHQKPIPLGINATETGEHKFIAEFNGNLKEIKQEFTAAQPLQLPAQTLNEDYRYMVMAFDPNGVNIGCFWIKVVPLLP